MSSYDGLQEIQRRERFIELLARLKEKKKGNKENLEFIIESFSAQYGVKPETAWEYVRSYKKLNLIKISYGRKRWRYIGNSEKEERIFGITI